MSAEPVTILVPVYRDVGDLRRCVESLMRNATTVSTPCELLLIDDASPEPAVRAYLDALAGGSLAVATTVLRNEQNLGFVGTVNRGLRVARGDVVVLNADTAVTPGWLDRLAALAAADDVATVTPLTSHGSICTLPDSVIDAFSLQGPDPQIDACADFVFRNSLRRYPEVITGVGFCMYTTRRALDAVGLLDEAAFGRGYGEEVDFCLRATRVGYRHLVDDSTFVYHRGGGSFGEEQQEGLARGARTLHERYPFFGPTNRKERSNDPVDVSFAALELALDERDASRPHVLEVLHGSPRGTGGTEKFIVALMENLSEEFDFSVMFPVQSGFLLETVWRVGTRIVRREFLLPGAPRQVTAVRDDVAAEALQTALDMFRFDAVHVHNLIGHSLAALDVLSRFDGAVLCSVHDLYLACPNFSLLYEKREPCGIPDDLSYCDRCLADIAESPMPGSPMVRELSLDYLGRFRATVASRLDAVDRWIFPTQSAADYFARVYEVAPERVEIIHHGSIVRLGRRGTEPDEDLLFGEPLRVAFVGLGWAKKGLDVVNHVAEQLRGSTIEIHHFGELKSPASPEIVAHGSYDNELLPDLLQRAGIQVVLLPGPYAETFGIVMTEALAAGIPVIGAGYGALGERIRGHGAGWVIDPMDPDGVTQLIARLDACRDEIARATRAVLAVSLETVKDMAHRYAALYRLDESSRRRRAEVRT